ncbi:TRAP transporter small permease [Mangrovicoccus sp. HB161399]|uniref:TRAP transporter small permease n=1 Tax=Mangrovicoccus sp. HB161399 TaxID=2720392 RepID=UPI0015566816|nr:TRAP transporter small permease [Mangrovicoccus sp. HB161399]
MDKIAKFTGVVARIGLWISGIGLVLMTAMIAAQVFFRYVLNDSLVWTEPAAILVMGWFILLGAAVGIREGYHLSFEVLLYLLPDRAKLVLYSISDVVVTAFGIGMVVYGWQLAAKTAGSTIPSLGFSGSVAFLPIISGGILVVLFSVERLARRAAGLPTSRFGDTAEH